MNDGLVYNAGEQGFDYAEGVEAYEHFRKNNIDFDGLFAQCDAHAVAVLNGLLRDGIAVPDKVSVIGCDNSPFCEMNHVPVSSVAQNFRDRGAAATRLLMDLIDGKDVKNAAVPPVLHARASS